VETVRSQVLYVLFFIELQSRRVFVVGCTAHPTAAWVTQQALHLTWQMEAGIRLLIHDRDSKFSRSFDEVFRAQGVDVVRTPYPAPQPAGRSPAMRPRSAWGRKGALARKSGP
jgi:hypothetical protein